MSEQEFDLAVIGAGPGGYVAAIRAAQLGMKTACIEMRPTLGGTCLNVGCIPSKALLTSSEKYAEAKHHFAQHGIIAGQIGLDLSAMMARKAKVVKDNTAGIDYLFKKNGVTRFLGRGSIPAVGQVTVTDNGKTETLRAKTILIATGSASATLPGITIDEKRLVSSTGALELTSVPKTMVVIGGGVIGLELGSVWQRLGAQVTVVEYLDRILAGMDDEIAQQMQRILTKQGLQFRLSTKVTEAVAHATGVNLTLAGVASGATEAMTADIVLVAVGRKPHTEGLGLQALGVQLDERGRIKTDKHFATNLAGIYAIGDVIAGPMLAHKAEEEGVVCVEMLAGQKPHINIDAIPNVVYTAPEVASVGKTEAELKAAGIAYKVGKFPFSANGRARAMGETEGMVKILADAVTDRVLGAHIIGPQAGSLIAELATAIEFGASAEDIARTCHAHPTLNEAVKEAALAVEGRAVHI
jgi:dihydrolipoamide dehydrogenase